ncbi:flagellar motor switching and energizing component [uncultured delta proteobacterium]|uniref:Flagellar motor switching and energizing component n=1 Tax=uncultured delta proteobacterium TaxID=34034 RepID=A0A212J5V2_9DELT|nr:flagellar motor switching and energizing component [uncultured delta proteobacterium]
MADEKDQDALAAEWAAALEEQDEPESAGKSDDDKLADEWAAALAEDEQKAVKKEKEQQTLAAQASPMTLKNMAEEANAPRVDSGRRELDFILDIPLDVSAELGRTRLLINELLQLGQGSVVELDKLAGEALEVYVNGKLVARGEAVVINEKFGVRLTDIISPIERVKQLG